jgi:Dyp-type peroxidase family
MRDIQGDVLPGFKRDHQAFLFAKVRDPAAAKVALATLRPSSGADVLDYRSAVRGTRRVGLEDPPFEGVWTNVAFTSSGVEQLLGPKFRGLDDDSFAAGLPPDPNDPIRAGLVGETDRWIVGSGDRKPDILVNTASDDPIRLGQKVATLWNVLTSNGGFSFLHEDRGDTIKIRPRTEHFGFVDGVSVPRFEPDIPGATARRPTGGPALPIGLLLLGQGYGGWRPKPKWQWMTNGSYMVWLRFRQDVDAFWSFCRIGAHRLTRAWAQAEHPYVISPEEFAALLVGRRLDARGTPLSRYPIGTNAVRVPDDRLNDFAFDRRTPGASGVPGVPADLTGRLCPVSAHIRKANPRRLDPNEARRVVVRRGIPFGSPVKELQWSTDEEKREERGLHFICYQRSIKEQFEHIQGAWANKQWDPEAAAGIDPVAGFPGITNDFELVFHGPPGTPSAQMNLFNGWIRATAGAYFFVPSISAYCEHFAR